METQALEVNCPCKREKCERHGDCEACRTHHQTKRKPPVCERTQEKTERRAHKPQE